MNLRPAEEQVWIAEAAGDFLAKELPITRVQRLADDPKGPGVDDATWRRCAALGWLGLGLPETADGVGLGLPEEVMLFRELGRHLTPGPFVSTVLGARLAHTAGEAELAREIVSGRLRVGMLNADLAVDAGREDLVLTLGDNTAVLSRILKHTAVEGIDPTVRFARVVTRPEVQIEGREASVLLDRARVLIAATLLGIIEATRDMSADYARTRIQFGAPIGTFQAVKHRCADMAVAAYATIGQVFQAALLVEADTDDASFHAASAFVLATTGAARCTADNIQNLGGIGFTWEHPAHLLLKRAHVLDIVLGPRRRAYVDVLSPERHSFA